MTDTTPLVARLRTMPEDNARLDIVRTVKRRVPAYTHTKLEYSWPLVARRNQSPPDGLWTAWILLAGRGFGKTRARPDIIVTRGTTYDNKDNLAPGFYAHIRAQYEGTRTGRQEIHADLLDQSEDALVWAISHLINRRITKIWI